MKKIKTHLFICTNKPDQEGRCGHKQSEKLRLELKEKCKTQAWSKEVRINSSGCLGRCEEGIVAVLYPKGEWFTELKSSDVDQLFQAVSSHASDPDPEKNK